ncbi:AAA domain-containing protein [Bacillus sp. CGMCC 1.16541]|uniref:AAA domain-containing protein n=1 Tax=Bacillus sp. CGMCC 1.16541 TaxID=2185143 RepID=UPI000D72F54D|nr:AAA domain-containing protein [Bacillus sp. CGMCC 1.16541]
MEKRTVHMFLKEWKRALSIEMNYLKEQGGDAHLLVDGEFITRNQDEFTYRFRMTDDVFLPDGSLVRLVHQNEEIKAEVITIEGREWMLKLPLFVGQQVERIELYSEPWELIEALIDRLEEVKDYRTKLSRVKRLMSADSPTKHNEKNIKSPLHELLFRARLNATTYIWGPPGTGKTYTLSRVIANHCRTKKKVLVLSHSNAAVDVLMNEVASYMKKKSLWKQGEVIRYGTSRQNETLSHKDVQSSFLLEKEYPEVIHELIELEEERIRLNRYSGLSNKLVSIDRQLSKLRGQKLELERELVDKAYIVGTTLSKATTDRTLYEKEYDLIVVDEISMAYTPQVAFATTLGKRAVVCGDFKQLPPIALSDHAYVHQWLREDLFYQTGIAQSVQKGEVPANLFILTKQRRMHPDISAFTNQYIYQGKVSDHSSVSVRQQIADQKPFQCRASILVDTSLLHAYAVKDVTTESRYNLISALLSISYLLRAFKSGIRSLGYVTPYKSQAKLVHQLVEDIGMSEYVAVSTVHRFQGSERDMMIFDVVDSAPQSRPGILLTDRNGDRLVNVALTRSRGKLITVADETYLQKRVSKERALFKLLQYLTKHNKKQQPSTFLKELIQHPKLAWYKPTDMRQLLKDLNRIKSNVLFCIPHTSSVPESVWQLLNQIKEVTVLTKEPKSVPLSHANVIYSTYPLSLLLIQNEVLWLNMPYGGHDNAMLSARVQASQTIELIRTYIDLTPEEYEYEKRPTITSTKPDYSLSNYLNVWERCPDCNSTREAEVTKRGKVRLLCHYCGNVGGVPSFIFERYIEYVDLKCANCQKPLHASSYEGRILACCSRCNVEIEPKDVL